jgi:hypothetical protein
MSVDRDRKWTDTGWRQQPEASSLSDVPWAGTISLASWITPTASHYMEDATMPARKVHTFRLSQEESALLDGLAARRGSTRTEIVRLLIAACDYPTAGPRLSEPVVALVPRGAKEALEGLARQDGRTECASLSALLREGRSSLRRHWR